MHAIVKNVPRGGAVYKDVPVPSPSRGQILIKVKATSICGTDVHIYDYNNWAKARVKPPLIMGHEFAGEVVEVGRDVSSFVVGDNVSGETHIPCMHCEQCRLGNFHICYNLRLRGVDVDGCFAEYLVADEFTVWRNDKELNYEVASAQEPLGNAVHTVFEGGGVEGKKVAVFGCGPIGIASVGLCSVSGAERVFAVDISEYRLELAKRFGADVILNPRHTDVVKAILEMTGGHGVDVFLEMAGVQDTITSGLRVLKPGGRASVLGIPDAPYTVDFGADLIQKNITIYGIFGRRMYSTWFTVSAYLRSSKFDLSKLITHRFKMEEYQKAFEVMKSGMSGKVVLLP
jgi:threonine 3-dehydrogenase